MSSIAYNKKETGMNTDFLEIVTNKEKVQKELIFYSLFLMVFENFVHHWKDTIRSFYSNGFAKDEQTGEYYDFVKVTWIDGVCHTSRDTEKEKDFNHIVFQRVKKNGRNNPKLSMFRWMADSQFIDDDDYIILEKCYEKRNDYAHDIAGCLNRFVTKEEKELLKSLIAISEKAAKKWILEIEIPTTPSEDLDMLLDEEGNYNPPDDVISGTQMFYSLVLANLKDIFDEKDEHADHEHCG
jgi:hypothetical protein